MARDRVRSHDIIRGGSAYVSEIKKTGTVTVLIIIFHCDTVRYGSMEWIRIV
jgi:hypothetical protein